MDMVNFYPLAHPILAKTKNQILLFFGGRWRIHVNSLKKYPQRNFEENPNILEFKEGGFLCYINLT